MRDLVTIEWIRERDSAGVVQNSDDSSLQDAITAVSAFVIQKVGHDFDELKESEQTLDGCETSKLYLTGKIAYPLRRLTAVFVDDVRVPLTNVIVRPHRMIGLITVLVHKTSNWDGFEVRIQGDFGWADVPDDVKEAVFRMVCNKINGYTDDKTVRSVTHPDGVSVEYAISDQVSRSRIGSGDVYADSVILKYWWKEGGGMV